MLGSVCKRFDWEEPGSIKVTWLDYGLSLDSSCSCLLSGLFSHFYFHEVFMILLGFKPYVCPKNNSIIKYINQDLKKFSSY